MAFFRSETRYEHYRQIYAPLDYLGDIGGLMDALVGIGAAFLYLFHLVASNALDPFLINKIFEKDNSSKIRNSSTRVKIQKLKQRKPFKLKQFGCLSKSTSLEKGLHRINNELDIVNFVK